MSNEVIILEETITLEEYGEQRYTFACRIVANWVKAGVVTSAQLGVKRQLMELYIPELAALLVASQILVEKQGYDRPGAGRGGMPPARLRQGQHMGGGLYIQD